MSAWHRRNPELAGTSRDPAMSVPAHRRAFEEIASTYAREDYCRVCSAFLDVGERGVCADCREDDPE